MYCHSDTRRFSAPMACGSVFSTEIHVPSNAYSDLLSGSMVLNWPPCDLIQPHQLAIVREYIGSFVIEIVGNFTTS